MVLNPKDGHPLSRMELFEGMEHALCVTQKDRYLQILEDFIKNVG